MAVGGRRVNIGASAAGYRPNYRAPKRQMHLGRLWRPLSVIAIIFIAFYVILFSPLFSVKGVEVRGNTKLTSVEITRQVQEILNASFLGNNNLFVDTDAVGRQLRERNYQIQKTKVERGLTGGLVVTIAEQQGTLQWRSSSSVFVLSGNGIAYAEVSKVDTRLPLVEDSTNLPVKLGQKIVPSSFVTFSSKLTGALKSVGLKPMRIIVPETTSELSVQSDRGFTMKFDTTRSLDSQMGDYRAVTARKIAPREYIDLRIAGKVFYK